MNVIYIQGIIQIGGLLLVGDDSYEHSIIDLD